MTSRRVVFTLLSLLSLLSLAIVAEAQNSRHFTFRYEFTVKSVDAGQPLRVWIPLAHSDRWQTVRITNMQGDLPLKKTQEKRFGNSMLYVTTAKATKPDYHFVVEYDVVRLERNDLTETQRQASEQPSPAGASVKPAAYDPSVRRYLAADKLVPVTGLPAQLATQTVSGKNSSCSRRARSTTRCSPI